MGYLHNIQVITKRLSAMFLLVAFAILGFSQQVTVKFTGQLNSSRYQRLDSVKVTNITRGWTETVHYPDTIAILSQTTGLETISSDADALYQNVPNPFDCTTTAELAISRSSDITLMLIDVNGRTLTSYNATLDAGIHKFEISAEKPQTYLLNAQVGTKSYSIRMVNIGTGCGNAIKYLGGTQDITAKLECLNEFRIGDNMGYTGYATINGNALASATFIQQQIASQHITLNFSSQATLPEVTTLSATAVSHTTATIRGWATGQTQAGFLYGTSPDNLQYNVTATQSLSEEFSAQLTGLAENTTYYYKAYAINSAGAASGETLSFTTTQSASTIPEVITYTAISISSNAATIRGYLQNGGQNTTLGFLYGNSPNNLQYNVTTSQTNNQEFSYRLTGLTPNTTYYFQAYATNITGSDIGDILNFTTTSQSASINPTVITLSATSVGPTSATINGEVTNGAEYTTIGFMYGTNPSNYNLQHNVIAEQTPSNGFSYQLNDLSPNTTYYFKAYATNSNGIFYGDLLNFRTTPTSSQYNVEINFSGLGNNNFNTYAYYFIPLDSVIIENLTRNWTRTLYYPDTTLYINFSSGRTIIDSNITSSDRLKCTGYTTYRNNSYTSEIRTITPSTNQNISLIFHIPYCDNKTTIIELQDCEPITYNGITYDHSGIYTIGQYITARGCDSTVLLDIRIRDHLFTEIEVNTCEDSYEFGDSIYTENGIYQYTYTSVNGCDSMVSLILTLGEGFRDARDGNVYCTVTIGDQVWMKENLRYLPQVHTESNKSDSYSRYYVYGYSGSNVNAAKATENYEKYGVLYNWNAAMTACPAGWHLPSDTEWTLLEIYLENNGYNFDGYIDSDNNRDTHNVIAKSLAATSGWTTSDIQNSPGILQPKNNSSGFNGKPGGENYIGGFHRINECAIWWTSTPNTGSNCWDRYIFFSRDFCNRTNNHRSIGMSVRCIQD